MVKILILFNFFFSTAAFALPARIILIRHGEKIDDSHNDLSSKGCERAYQLVNFFGEFKNDTAAIYAQGVKKASSSIRALETIAPTAKLFFLKINNTFLRDDTATLAKEVLSEPKYEGKTIVVAWEHSAIIDLAEELGIKLTSQLKKWPSSIFDQAWIITYRSSEVKSAMLKIVAEHVLPTDIENGQSGVENWGSEISPSTNGIIVPSEIIKICSTGNQSLDLLLKNLLLKPLPIF